VFIITPQGAKTLLVGFPGGKVCTEKHIPGYVAAVSSYGLGGLVPLVWCGVMTRSISATATSWY